MKSSFRLFLFLLVFILSSNYSFPDDGSRNNNPPNTPTVTEPLFDGRIVNAADVHMETGPFSDPDAGDTHLCSDWEIWTVSPSELIWITSCIGGPQKIHTHLGDGTFLGSHAGRTELFTDRDYRLRVRHRDNSGDPSTEWSAWAMRLFRTAPPVTPLPNQPHWLVKQPGYKVELADSGFQLPVNIAFIPNAAIHPSAPFYYVAELYGTIKVVTRDGTILDYADSLLNFDPTGNFPGTGEQGLAGLAVDSVSGDVFASMMYSSVPGVENVPHYPKVVRFHSTDGGLTAATQTTILDMVGEEQGQSHQISNVTIGPDGKLYVHLGDGFDAARAQDLNSFRGKILRMNLNGTAPSDNPFYNTSDGITARDYIYAYGFRNPFGGAWRLSDTAHYEVENGPSIDRFAKVVRGRNYLWDGSDESMASYAIYNWNPATAPVNIAFIQSQIFGGSGFPADKFGHAFVSESGPTWASGPQSNGKRISEFVVDSLGNFVGGPTPLIEYNDTGKATVVALAAGPDGLYFSDLYKDEDYVSPIDRGAKILRVRFIGLPPAGNGTGAHAAYFNDMNLTTQVLARTDTTIDFDWGNGSPDPSISNDNFSARWAGQVLPQYNETYTFYVRADDGIRLWINNRVVVDQWIDQPPTEWSDTITLNAGTKYNLKMEFYENGGGAVAQLFWSSVSLPKQVIPKSQLFPTYTDSVPPIPVLLSPPDNSFGVPNPPTLAWNPTANTDFYRLQVAEDSLFNMIVRDDSTITVSNQVIDSLSDSTKYYWHVKSKNSLGYSAWSAQWNFTTAGGITKQYSVNQRWNLVSVPLIVPNSLKGVLYPSAVSGAIKFNPQSGYQQKDTLQNGIGYWLKFNSPQLISITGTPLTFDTIEVSQGWNLVGTLSDTIPSASVISIPTGILSSQFFSYDGGYSKTSELIPGKAYWVKTTSSGRIVLVAPSGTIENSTLPRAKR